MIFHNIGYNKADFGTNSDFQPGSPRILYRKFYSNLKNTTTLDIEKIQRRMYLFLKQLIPTKRT